MRELLVWRLLGLTQRNFLLWWLKLRFALSSYHCALVMDEMTIQIQDDISWCIANNIILIYWIGTKVDQKFELWKSSSEPKGFRLNWAKMEYVHYNFSNFRNKRLVVNQNDIEMPKCDHWWDLSPITQKRETLRRIFPNQCRVVEIFMWWKHPS